MPQHYVPTVDIRDALDVLDRRSTPSGISPPGVQQLVTVRDGGSMSFGLGPLMQSQPGVVEGEELWWGADEARSCLVAATSRDCLLRALSDADNPRDPTTRKKHVDADSSIYAGRNGELTTTIPKAARPSHVPIPDGAADLIDPASIPTPDVPDPEPGMYYVAVAEHYAIGSRQETAFLFLSVPRLASDITLANLRGDGEQYAQPLLTTNDHQARVLCRLGGDHRELSAYRDRLETCDSLPDDIERTLLHGDGSLPPVAVRNALDRLKRLGGAALLSQ